MQAQGHGVCDHNSFERAMNIISSVPYTMIGLHTLRRVFAPRALLAWPSLLSP